MIFFIPCQLSPCDIKISFTESLPSMLGVTKTSLLLQQQYGDKIICEGLWICYLFSRLPDAVVSD